MYKSSHASQAFLSREASFSTHGTRNGVIAVAPLVDDKTLRQERVLNYQMTPEERRQLSDVENKARHRASKAGKRRKVSTPHSHKMNEIIRKQTILLESQA